MNNNTSKVSVIVLTYNQQNTIRRTLDSILSQESTYEYEIIIGEDASADATRDICQEYATKYPDIIRLMPQAPNKGILKNYADCLAECRGEYIACCGGDDWWHDKNKMQLQVEFLESHPEYVLCHSGAIISNIVIGTEKEIKCVNIEKDIFTHLLRANFVIAPTTCFRKSMLAHISIEEFARAGYRMEDYPMWLIMSQYGKFHGLNKSLVTYTLSNNSASNHAELEKQVAYEENTRMIKLDIISKFHKEAEFPETLINDHHYRTLYSHSIKFADKRSARDFILKVKDKNARDWVKVLVTYIPFAFYYITKRNSITSAKK